MKRTKNAKINIMIMIALIIVFSCSFFGISSVTINKDGNDKTELVAVDDNKGVNENDDEKDIVTENSYVVKNWNDVMLEKHYENIIIFDGGSGTADDPFLISTPEQLAFMAYTKTNYLPALTGAFTGRMDQSNRNENLPSQYVQLEYLEGTGSEWINTGFTTATCDGFEIEFATTDIGNVNNYGLNGILGCNGTKGDDFKLWYYYNQNKYRFYIDTSYVEMPVEDVSAWHKVKYENQTIYYNDVSVGDIELEPAKKGTPIGLFDVSNTAGSASSFYSKTKVKSFKLYFEGNLVQDLVPCYRLQDGYPGMYDLVSGAFLTDKTSFNYMKYKNEKNTHYKLVDDIFLNDGKLSVEEDTSDDALRPYKLVYTGDKDGILYTWTSAMAPEDVTNYSASIDFNGFKISGMYIDSTEDNQGFFGNLSSGYMKNGKFENFVVFGGGNIGGLQGIHSTKISDMIVDGCVIGSATRVGVIVGVGTNTTLTNCTSRGFAYSADQSVGGQVGWGYSTLHFKNCRNEADVIGSGYVGGICGINGDATLGGNILNCVNYGNVTGLTTGPAGGIVANQRASKISDCKNYGIVKNESANTGGIAGYMAGTTITDCVNYGDVQGASNTGGVVGKRYYAQGGREQNLTNYGNVSGTTAVGGISGNGGGHSFRNYGIVKGGRMVGGLIGQATATTRNSQNHGTVYGTEEYVAGLIGTMGGRIMLCINYGDVISTGTYTAGLIGMTETSLVLQDCKNFGNIFGKDCVSGFIGFISSPPNGSVHLKRLSNYGKLKGDTSVKAFIAYVHRGNISVNDCLNAGNITTGQSLSETKANIFGHGGLINCISSSLINNVRKSYFIGDNFDAFCYDFRKNKYHLNEDVFQTFWIDKVTKEFLISKNFVEF